MPMSKLVLGLILGVATAFTMPAVSVAKSAPKAASAEKSEGAAPLDKDAQQKLKEHVRMRNHVVKNVKYPATKESVVTAFKGFKDVKPDDKKWLEETLPSKTYETSDDVVRALGWEVEPAAPPTTAKNGK
jgi:hypothetical protein